MPPTTLFPYPVLDTDPTLQLSGPKVDGRPAQLLPREGRVDLSERPAKWRAASVNVRVQVPVESLEQIGVRHHEVVATLHCAPTNLRATVPLEPDGGGGQWTGVVELPGDMLRERAVLSATVTGTVEGVAHRWLGRSQEVAVDLLPPRTPEISGGQVPVVWRDFSKTEDGQNPIDPALHDEMAWLDMSLPEGPVIYLNERVDGMRRLLEVRTGRARVERAVRETALDLIAVPAIAAMANVALAGADPPGEGGEPQWPDTDWQRDVLRTLLPLMYPDQEPESALSTAVRAIAGGEDAEDVQARLVGAASRLVRATRHVGGVVKALESLEGEE
jgi:hypothetical protein